jgi:AraC-like DNA-binding protein
VPWSRVLTFTDPFPYQSAIRAADLELLPTARGEFRANLTQVCMNQLWMQRFYQNLPLVNVGSMKPGRRVISFLTAANQPALHHCGVDVVPGEIIVNNVDMLHQRTGADLSLGGMSLKSDVFDAACKAITGREFSETTKTHLVRSSPALMSRLLKLHETVGQIAETIPGILELAEAVRSLEQQLIHLMVRCLTEGMPSGTTAGNRRHDLIVTRFEEFLEANPNKPLYLPEICAAINTAERTLRVACEEHLGMGPIRYLALRRMHLARRALLRAKPSITVTQVATDHGFWELGRFAVAYRALFGESPSETLHRPFTSRRTSPDRPSSLTGAHIW